MPSKQRRKAVCDCCGHTGFYVGKGYIRECWSRWERAGYPEDGPPAPGYRINWDRYEWLRTIGFASMTSAAQQTGISERTAYRYEKRLKEMGLV